jgi:hypothetical protein
LGKDDRIDLLRLPPFRFVTGVVERKVMEAA